MASLILVAVLASFTIVYGLNYKDNEKVMLYIACK